MSAPLPPLHAFAIVHAPPRRRPATPARPSHGQATLARLWNWLMEPIAHGDQPTARAQLLRRIRHAQRPSQHECAQG